MGERYKGREGSEGRRSLLVFLVVEGIYLALMPAEQPCSVGGEWGVCGCSVGAVWEEVKEKGEGRVRCIYIVRACVGSYLADCDGGMRRMMQ